MALINEARYVNPKEQVSFKVEAKDKKYSISGLTCMKCGAKVTNIHRHPKNPKVAIYAHRVNNRGHVYTTYCEVDSYAL